jgi:hypothetical protein
LQLRILSILADVPASMTITKERNIDFSILRFSQGEKPIFAAYLGWYPSFRRYERENLPLKKYRINGLAAQRYSPPAKEGVTSVEYLIQLKYRDWGEYIHFFITTDSKEEIRLFEEIVASIRPLPTDRKILRCCVGGADKYTLTIYASMFLYKDRDIRRINGLLAQVAPTPSVAPGDPWYAIEHPESKTIVYVCENGVVERNRKFYQMQSKAFNEFRKAMDELHEEWKKTPSVAPFKPE